MTLILLICFFQGDPAIVSGAGADWSPWSDALGFDWYATYVYNPAADGRYELVIEPTAWPEENRWFATVRPVPPVTEDVCLWGELTPRYKGVFADGFESGDLGAWAGTTSAKLKVTRLLAVRNKKLEVEARTRERVAP